MRESWQAALTPNKNRRKKHFYFQILLILNVATFLYGNKLLKRVEVTFNKQSDCIKTAFASMEYYTQNTAASNGD